MVFNYLICFEKLLVLISCISCCLKLCSAFQKRNFFLWPRTHGDTQTKTIVVDVVLNRGLPSSPRLLLPTSCTRAVVEVGRATSTSSSCTTHHVRIDGVRENGTASIVILSRSRGFRFRLYGIFPPRTTTRPFDGPVTEIARHSRQVPTRRRVFPTQGAGFRLYRFLR